MDCLFCKIAADAIPVQKVFEDDTIVAFADIHPQAPVHLLIIPRKHIASLAHLSPEDERLLGHMHGLAKKIAEQQGLRNGFRTVMNTGAGRRPDRRRTCTCTCWVAAPCIGLPDDRRFIPKSGLSQSLREDR